MSYEVIGWLIAIVVFIAAEAATVALVSVWFIGGAVCALVAAILGAGLGVQLAVFLVVSAALLVVTALGSLAKGFIFMPDMDMPSVNVTLTMPEDADMAEATALADQVLDRISEIDGIETVGAMMGSSTSMLSMGSGESHDVTVYITLADDTASGAAVGKQIEEACADLPCEVTTSSAMMDMSMLLSLIHI